MSATTVKIPAEYAEVTQLTDAIEWATGESARMEALRQAELAAEAA